MHGGLREEDLLELFPCIHLTLAGWGGEVCSAHLDDTEIPSLTCVKSVTHQPSAEEQELCPEKDIFQFQV